MSRENQPKPLDYETPPSPRRPGVVPMYRKALSAILVGAGLAFAPFALTTANESARVNILTVTGGLVVWGLVIRYQHVRF